MAEDITYKISIEGAGLSLEREVSKEIGERVVVLLLTGAVPTTKGVPAAKPAVASPTHTPAQTQQAPIVAPQQHAGAQPEISIREFLDSCEAKRIPDKITAIGIYLKSQSSQSDFNKNDLILQFESAAEPVPANISRDLKWTLKAGWIALKSGSKDRYYVTNTGNTAVEQKFSKDVVKKTRGLVSGGNKKSPTAQTSEG